MSWRVCCPHHWSWYYSTCWKWYSLSTSHLYHWHIAVCDIHRKFLLIF